MKRIQFTILLVAAAVFAAACGMPANNAPANNTNTAKPTAAAPTVDALFAMDKAANEAWIKGDKAHFEGMLSDKFVSAEMGKRMSKAELLQMVGSMKCDVKTWELTDPQMSMINADTYVMSYKGTFDGSCTGPDGKSMKIPSPVRAASVWVRNGDKWQGAYHGENVIVDPAAPKAPVEKAAADKKPASAAAADDAADADVDAKKEADEAGKETAKAMKEAGTKDAAKSDTTTVAAKAASSANTAALVALHTSGWEAFKARDAKKFDAMLTTNFVFVDPIGGYHSGKAEAIKIWTETMKCEGITKVSFTDGVATALSPTVEILTGKGTADGTCDGQKNGDLWTTAVYVKEGDAWKLAFMLENAG